VPELGSLGSVRGVLRNERPYRECENFPLVSLGRLLYDMIGNSLGTIEWASRRFPARLQHRPWRGIVRDDAGHSDSSPVPDARCVSRHA